MKKNVIILVLSITSILLLIYAISQRSAADQLKQEAMIEHKIADQQKMLLEECKMIAEEHRIAADSARAAAMQAERRALRAMKLADQTQIEN